MADDKTVVSQMGPQAGALGLMCALLLDASTALDKNPKCQCTVCVRLRKAFDEAESNGLL